MVEFKFETQDWTVAKTTQRAPSPVHTKTAMQLYYEDLREKAVTLAGAPKDLVQRAAVYHHLYEHSNGNHTFPLIAAHGALWGSGYFALGTKAGKVLAAQFVLKPHLKRDKLTQLEAFAESFREINRQVCVESYIAYYMTDKFGKTDALRQYFPESFINALHKCHTARRLGLDLTPEDKRALFEVFFLWEQDNVVHPGVKKAASLLDWPIIKWIALKPVITFKYFPRLKPMFFSKFLNKAERIEKGLQAFEHARRAGWDKVDASLTDYGIMPAGFKTNTQQYYKTHVQSLLA